MRTIVPFERVSAKINEVEPLGGPGFLKEIRLGSILALPALSNKDVRTRGFAPTKAWCAKSDGG
jgi:hypothetical protein